MNVMRWVTIEISVLSELAVLPQLHLRLHRMVEALEEEEEAVDVVVVVRLEPMEEQEAELHMLEQYLQNQPLLTMRMRGLQCMPRLIILGFKINTQ